MRAIVRTMLPARIWSRSASATSAGRLVTVWAQPSATAEHDGWPRFTEPECAEMYRHAARQAAAATEHLRRCTAGNPGQGADAAWATADALHAAARALHSPILRCAAAGYDRAARASYGRIPPRTRQGDELRTAARLLAMTGTVLGGSTGQASALIASLIALIDAVAALRQAQEHAAQARAALQAAKQLHTAWTQARDRAPHPGRAHTRPTTAPARTLSDFPVPITGVARRQDPGVQLPYRYNHHVRAAGRTAGLHLRSRGVRARTITPTAKGARLLSSRALQAGLRGAGWRSVFVTRWTSTRSRPSISSTP